MKDVTVYPGKASGIVPASPCVDEEIRAAVLASITKTGIWQTDSCCKAEDVYNALFGMGAKFRKQDDTITFYSPPQEGTAVIKCCRSVFDLILPLCAVLGGEYSFPQEFDYEAAKTLEGMGVECSCDNEAMTLKGRIEPGDVVLEDGRLLDGFLLCLPIMKGAAVHYVGTENAELPLSILKEFGYKIDSRDGFRIEQERYSDESYVFRAGGDYAMSAYTMLFGFFGGEAGVTGLLAESAQPQKRIIEEFRKLKLNVQEYSGAVFAEKSRAQAEVIDISESVEPAVVLALCCFGKGRCVIKNSGCIREQKKRDFDTVLIGLKSIGADIMQIGEDLLIAGRQTVLGGKANARGSERASLVFAAAALLSETGVTIDRPCCLEGLSTLGVSFI